MEAAQLPWRPLGELFVGRGLITEDELEMALAEQAASGKRLGEILVERGLVSSPDLTSALMDQLGVEISKEEGFGSGLWAEIKRRHKRVRQDDEGEREADEGFEAGFEVEPEAEIDAPEIALVAPEAPLAFESQPEPEPELEPVGVDPGLEQELEEIRADYQSPAEREPEPVLELVVVPEPELADEPEAELDDEPELEPAAEVPRFEPVPVPEPEPEPEPAIALVPAPVAESDDAATLRAELEKARADLVRLQEMLADSMTALAALTPEAAPYAE